MLKILQARLQHTWTEKFHTFKLDIEKAEEPEINCNIRWIIEKPGEFQKNIYFCIIDYAKAFDCVENCSRDGKYQSTLPASWEICMQGRKQQLELDMEQQTGSKQEKEYVKATYCHPAYLTSMQSTS